MFSPRYNGTQMWVQLTSPVVSAANTPRPSPLDEKRFELDTVKKTVSSHLRELDRLYIEYMDWFERRAREFLMTIDEVQVSLPTLVPSRIENLQNFITILEFSERLVNAGRRLAHQQLLNEFRHFWDRFTELNTTTDLTIYPMICKYCDSISALRNPEVKQHIDCLHQRLATEFSLQFDFTELHNERDHRFTYRLGLSQQGYLGLVQYIPYLLQCARKLCYVALKLHVEKE